MKINSGYGKRVTLVRLDTELGKQAFARAALSDGASAKNISRIEIEEVTPRPMTLAKIASFGGVSLEWLAKGKIFHMHGKDASVDWAGIRRWGIRSPRQHVHHRTPGFGDTNWTDVISILRQHKFKGAIDIEGWHDPVYHGELEMTGQVHGLRYLQQCRGGEFVANPKV